MAKWSKSAVEKINAYQEENPNIFSPLSVIIASVIVVIILSILLSDFHLGFVGIIIVFALFSFFAKQAESERVLKQSEMGEVEKEFIDLYDQLNLVYEHNEENPSDLNGKMKARELEKEVANYLEEYPFLEERMDVENEEEKK